MKNSKKDNHEKKKKKKHKRRHNSSTSSSESESDKELKWVEASPPKEHEIKLKKKKKKSKRKSSSESDSPDSEEIRPSLTECGKAREPMMDEDFYIPTFSKDQMVSQTSSRQRRLDALKEKKERDDKIKSDRELNPHWKNDGSGLPETEANVESLSLPSTSVGDGGYSWLKKAYLRIQEQAQREGRPMEEVAVERWGSLDKLVSLNDEAEARMKSRPDSKRNFIQNRYQKEYEKSSSNRFRKPDESNHQSPKKSFEYSKPSSSRNKDKLNHFKSSRNSNFYDYDKYEEKTQRASETMTDIKCENTFDPATKANLRPAWKKPKFNEKRESQDDAPEQKIEATMESKLLDEIPPIYSEEDLNKLAAKKFQAEMMGNSELAADIEKQLQEARNNVNEQGFAQKPPKRTEEVTLTKLSSQGVAHPIEFSEDQMSNYKHKKSKKFFDDGSKYSLKQMFEREKLTTADDQMEMFVEASAKCDDSSEIDFELGNVSKKLTQKMAAGREEEKDIGKAILQHQKLKGAIEKCAYCVDNMKTYLLLDVGEQVYLCLPNYQTMTEGHCLIVPKSHVSSLLFLDENEWREVDLFKSHLRNMFRPEGKSVIFIETSMNFRYFPHAVLECIPVPEEEGDMAPLYFKKAIQESEAEWAHNKKLIDLRGKGLRHSVPKNLPYFYVEFDPRVHAGYAHVIEEEKYFPRNFGKEIIGGMLDIDYNHLYKNRREDPLKKSKEVVEFQHKWKKFKSDSDNA